MLRWCCKNKDISTFFRVIKKELPQVKQSIQNPKMQIEEFGRDQSTFDVLKSRLALITSKYINSISENLSELGMPHHETGHSNFSNQESKQSQQTSKIEWIIKLRNKFSTNRGNESISNISMGISWIYGMRCANQTKSFCYHNDNKGKGTSEKLVYISGKVIVIFLFKLNEQKHYTQHLNEVTALSSCNSEKNLIASGEGNTKHPAIHIWDINTLKSLVEFKGYHKSDIYLLEFLKNDRFLASCSLRSDTPIFIFDRLTKEVVFSYKIDYLVRGIVPIQLINIPDLAKSNKENKFEPAPKIHKNFIVYCENQLLYFKQNNLHSVLKIQEITKFESLQPITSCMSMVLVKKDLELNKQTDKDQTYTDKKSKNRLLTLTGHKDGKCILWQNMVPFKKVFDFGFEIVDMCTILPFIAITSDDFKIHITNLNLDVVLRTVDLRKHNFKYHSFSLKNIVPCQGDLILNTYLGDFIKIKLLNKDHFMFKSMFAQSGGQNQKTEFRDSRGFKDTKSDSFKLKTKEKKLLHIPVFRGNIKAVALIEKDEEKLNFLVCDQHFSYGFSSENRDLIDYFYYPEEELTTIEAAILEDQDIILVYGTEEGKVFFRENWVVSGKEFSLDSEIHTLKFSYNLDFLIAMTANGSFFQISQTGGNYDHISRSFTLDNEIPISVNFNEELTDLVVTTIKNKIYTLSVKNFKVRDQNEIDADYINLRRGYFKYALATEKDLKNRENIDRNMQINEDCVILGNDLDYTICSDSHGNLVFYKNKANLENGCGVYSLAHLSKIQEIKLSVMKTHLITIGLSDHMCIEWELNTQYSGGKHRVVLQGKGLELIKELEESKLIKREIEFCRRLDSHFTLCGDSFTLARGCKNKKLNFMTSQEKDHYSEDRYLMKRIPEISIRLNHVYGIESFHRRDTLFYLHFYNLGDQKELESELKQKDQQQNKLEEIPLHPNYIKEMLFSKFSTLPYDKKHNNCDRRFCYFTSRVAVIGKNDLDTLNQTFYEGHKAKISCMAVHRTKMIVATGEACQSPLIHVWSALNTNLISKVKTYHQFGILQLKFSYDGFYLISVGVDKNYSIQVTDWKNNQVIAVSNTSSSPIMNLAVNPYDRSQFATCGLKKVQIWQVNGRTLELKENIDIPKDINNGANYLVCISYIYYLLGDEVITDLVLGNSYGDIGLVTCEKYITLKKEAHKGMINCLKITDCLSEKLMVVTAGQDEYIKFWDTSFNLIKSYNLRKHNISSLVKSEKTLNVNLSAQSVDFFPCKAPPALRINNKMVTGYDAPTPKMLICTRNGDIIEINLTYKFNGQDVAQDQKEKLGDSASDSESNPAIKKQKKQGNEKKRVSTMSDSDSQKSEDNDEGEERDQNLIDFDQHVIISYPVTQSSEAVQKTMSESGSASKSMSHSSSDELESHSKDEDKEVDEVLNFKFRKIYFAVKKRGDLEIMVTASTNGHLNIWNTQTHADSHSTLLEDSPSDLTFSEDNLYLAVGLRNGKVLIFSDLKSKEFELVTTINTNESSQTSAVVRIVFSKDSSFLAVSYLPLNLKSSAGKDIYSKRGGYVTVYECKRRDVNKPSRNSNYDISYVKKNVIWNPKSNSQETVNSMGCYYLAFDTTLNYLIAVFQNFDSYLNRDLEDKEKLLAFYNLGTELEENNKDVLKRHTLEKFDFPNQINALSRSLISDGSQDEKTYQIKDLNMSSCARHAEKGFFVLGSSKGEINIVKSSFLYLEEELNPENLDLTKYCLAKNYAGHCTPVDHIQTCGDNKLYTSGSNSENVFEWLIDIGKKDWELDHKDYDLKMEDIFLRAIEKKEEYLKIVNEMLPLRNEILQLSQNVDTGVKPEVRLELDKVIGRNSFNRRNNLFYTEDNHLIFSAATLIVKMNIPPEGFKLEETSRKKFFKEKFLLPDSKNEYSISPQISTLAVSHDRKYLAVGTIQTKAKLLTWELTSETFMDSFTFEDCCVVQNISFSSDMKRIATVVLTKDYTQRVYLMDTFGLEVVGICELSYSTPVKIKEIYFLPKTSSEFITIGLQHMARWFLKGGRITLEELPIENPNDIMERAGVLHNLHERESRMKNGEYTAVYDDLGREIFPLDVTFLALIFIYDDLIVTGGDDGYLYIWKNFKIIKKKEAHLNSTILCMSGSSYHPNLFVTGAMDGSVNLWEMSNPESGNHFIIEKTFDYPLGTEQYISKGIKNTESHVQSLQFRFNKIIAGTRSGDIYFLTLPAASEIKSSATDSKNLIERIYCCNDNRIPKEVDFDANNNRIVYISTQGLFNIWDFEDLSLKVSINFNEQTTNMIVFKSILYVAISFEKRLIILDIHQDNNIHEILTFTQNFQLVTSDIKVNIDESILAVAMAPNYEVCTEIKIFKIDFQEKKLDLFHSISNISSSIEFMDFSSDNVYLMYMDNIKKKCYFDLKNKVKDESENLNLRYDVEWISEGLKTSDKIRGLAPCYTEDNQITCLVKIGQRSMIAGDQIGTLRIFNYPCEYSSYYQMYSHHLSYIITCHVSKDGRHLVTCSSIDKSILIWRIIEEEGNGGDELSKKTSHYGGNY